MTRVPSDRRRATLGLAAAGLAPSVAPTLAALLSAGAGPASAQAPVEVSFYYPVAVGGPIAKVIDGFAEGFMKENPGVRITPVYAGTYQETIVKALTAHKAGTPPVTSVLLSTDLFTLVDEGAIVPFDEFATTAEDKAFYAGADTGFISQNVYLYCAAMDLATVVRANIDTAALAKAMGLPATKRVTLAQTVGYPKS